MSNRFAWNQVLCITLEYLAVRNVPINLVVKQCIETNMLWSHRAKKEGKQVFLHVKTKNIDLI